MTPLEKLPKALEGPNNYVRRAKTIWRLHSLAVPTAVQGCVLVRQIVFSSIQIEKYATTYGAPYWTDLSVVWLTVYRSVARVSLGISVDGFNFRSLFKIQKLPTMSFSFNAQFLWNFLKDLKKSSVWEPSSEKWKMKGSAKPIEPMLMAPLGHHR